MSQGAFFSLLIIIVIFFKKSSNNFSRMEILIMTPQIFGRNPPITPSAASLPFSTSLSYLFNRLSASTLISSLKDTGSRMRL
jgi:hypothetical protein